MLTEIQLAATLKTTLEAIEPPPVPLREIQRRIEESQASRTAGRRFVIAAAAAVVAMAVLAFPKIAPGITQTVEQQIEAILHWTPPPPPPASVESQLQSQTRTSNLAVAQAKVSFTIVPPAGLPGDVVSEKIATTPTGVYSYVTHRWSVGGPAVWFIYARTGGGSFTLLADRFDPGEGPPVTHIFEDLGERDGREILVKHDKFSWRNGDQVMSALAGQGLSAVEIARIRTAMHGMVITGVPSRATIVKQYRLP